MALRIYFIPYDLPNVQGKLRVRKENVLNPAKRYMRNLVPRISQDWMGLETTAFMPNLQVHYLETEAFHIY